MEDLDSVFIYQEREHKLRQKLMDVTLELETAKNNDMELFNLLKMAYQERDEARCQLKKLMNKLMPFSPNHLQNLFDRVQHESLLMLPATTEANSSFTESNSLSHGSPSLDSFFDSVSSPEFSNINAVDSNNKIGYLNQHLVQDFNCLPYPALMVSSEKPVSDPAAAVIDILAKGRDLPQKGKLVQAMMDAGPLLQTVLLSESLPTWQNPPPLQGIKLPPLTIKKHDTTSIEPNSFTNTGNSFIEPKLPSLRSSNAPSTGSDFMFNFTGQPHGSWNNALELTSSSNVRIQFPSRKRQRLQ